MLNTTAIGPVPTWNGGYLAQAQHNLGNVNFVPGMMNTVAIPPPTILGYDPLQSQLPVSLPATAIGLFDCTQPGCQSSFRRDGDRIRHEASKHGVNGTLHVCQVAGCPKSQGVGYKRKDKLTEHMWKKHADLGFVKRVQ